MGYSKFQFDLDALQNERLNRGWSYNKIARELDMDTSTIHKTLHGVRCAPKTIRRIADLLGIDKIILANGGKRRKSA
jgi:ribosome-binding protein aMBF1 (putative translation factor)